MLLMLPSTTFHFFGGAGEGPGGAGPGPGDGDHLQDKPGPLKGQQQRQ